MGGKAVSWKIHRSSFLPLFYATCLKMPICTLNLSPEKRVDTFQDFLIAEHMKPRKYVYVMANVESRLELSQLNSSPQV